MKRRNFFATLLGSLFVGKAATLSNNKATSINDFTATPDDLNVAIDPLSKSPYSNYALGIGLAKPIEHPKSIKDLADRRYAESIIADVASQYKVWEC